MTKRTPAKRAARPGRVSALRDISPEFVSERKAYGSAPPIDGVQLLPLRRFTDDRGCFMEVFRRRSNHAGTEALASFFEGVTVEQCNFSILSVQNHVKGLHYHLKQDDIWFCPPPSKMKVVLLDVRKASPTVGVAQSVVLGGGRDALLRIPHGVAHGYRALTHPCSLFYLVSRTFDLADPDEYRIPWDHPSVKSLWEIPKS